jgi:hypothetical protein
MAIDVSPTLNTQTLGTVTSGTWNGSVITGAYGGTGVNNGSKTITLGGNLATSGAFNLTIAVPRTTTYTLPDTASDTLAGLGTIQTFTVAQTISANLTITTGALTVASDTDAQTILGRAKIFSAVSDFAYFAHFDRANTTDYALVQSAAGTVTAVNTASGGTVHIRVAGSNKLSTTTTETKVVSGSNFWLGNAAVTGLVAGALAGTTNASIVIYDSAGQAYRIPCII